MKLFVKNIALFSIVIIMIIAAAEIYVENLSNPCKDKHKWMLAHSENVETLVLGSSHTYYGIRPDMLGKNAYSLALVSQTYRYDAYLLQHYNMPKLKNVIIPFSYFSLWEDIDLQKEMSFEATRYRIYMDCDIHSRIGEYGFEFMHINSFKEKLKSIYTPSKMSWDEYGWGTNYTIESRNEDWDNGEIRAKNNTYPDNSEYVSLNINFLQNIIDFCNNRNIKVTIITTPVSDTFLKYESSYQKEINKKELRRILKQNPNIKYLNFENDSSFTDKDFYDADHLNTDGATKLTLKLSEMMRN